MQPPRQLQDRPSEALVAARDFEARYRVIADSMRDIVVQLEGDGRIVYISPSCRMLGFTPQELTGRPTSDFVHPDDVERMAANTAHLMTGVLDLTRDRRYRLRLKDGSYRWYEGNPNHVLDEAGAVTGIVNIIRDVHERELAAAALAESEARYRLLAENLSDLVVRLDVDGRIAYVSPSWRVLGYAPEDLIGRLGRDLVHPEEVPRLLENVARVLGGVGGVVDHYFRLRAKDGSYRRYEGSPSQATDEAGRVVGLINILRDVTEQFAVQEALAASETRYRLLAEHMTDVVVQLDAEGRIQYVSPSCRALGYAPEDLIGRDRSEFIHADEVPRLLDNMAHLKSGVLDRRRDRSHRIRVKGGGYRWFEGVPNPITDENGVLVGVVNVLRDVHEARAAEEELAASEARYRLLADNMGDIVACYGRDGVATFVSGATKAILGYETAELVGREIRTLIHPDDAKAAAPLYAQHVAEGPGAPAFRFQYRMPRKDGSLIWMEAQPRARYDADGEFVEWQDVVRDISEHKALEEQLRGAQRGADAATKTKAEFLADMSHELRGPLTSIVGFSRLARGRPGVAASVRTYLERIEHASVDLIGMVNDILDFSRLEAAEVVFRPRPVAVSELARSALSFLEPQARAKDLELRLIDRTPAGLVVSLDDGRVRQVLLNLLGNAVKFTHAGHVTLEVHYDPSTRRLSAEVRDTGPGIPADRVGQLFGRFTQVSDDGGVRPYAGAGLGLAISKGIVEGLGGEVAAESKVGRGSCFSFWIPAPPAAEPANDPDEAAPRFRVLVVDGDADTRDMIVDTLAPLKVRVLAAADVETALKLTAREPVDVVVADLDLAKAGGYAALRRLRGRRGRKSAAPVLALAHSADEALYAEVVAEGFHGLVARPFSPSELVSAIAHALAVADAPA